MNFSSVEYVLLISYMSKSFYDRFLLNNDPYFQDPEYFEEGELYIHFLCREIKSQKRIRDEEYCVIDEFCPCEIAGIFVNYSRYGFGDNANVKMNFLKRNGEIQTYLLDYVGRTRFCKILYIDIISDLKMYANFMKGFVSFQSVFSNPHLVFLIIEYLYSKKCVEFVRGYLY